MENEKRWRVVKETPHTTLLPLSVTVIGPISRTSGEVPFEAQATIASQEVPNYDNYNTTL